MANITYKTGNFLHFIARKSFSLGSTGLSLTEGTSVYFDGTMASIGSEDSERHSAINLRGAINSGWLILADQYDADDTEGLRPVSAQMKVRPADGGVITHDKVPSRGFVTTVHSDEMIVGSRSNRAEQLKTNNMEKTAKRSSQDLGGQTTVVRAISTPAIQVTSVTPNSVGEAIRQADSVKIQPGEGRTEEDFLHNMTEEEQELYLSKKQAIRSAYTSTIPDQTSVKPTKRVVSKVATSKKTVESGGMSSTVTFGKGSSDVEDLTVLDSGTAKVEQIEVGGIKFTNTNGPRKAAPVAKTATQSPRVVRDGTEDPRKRLAKKFCADFPDDYDFSDHWKRRIALIRLNYETRQDIIQAIFMAESDDFKKVLLEEFPEVFEQSA